MKILRFSEKKLYLHSATFLRKWQLPLMTKFLAVINIEKTEAKYFEKRQRPKKNYNISDCRNP